MIPTTVIETTFEELAAFMRTLPDDQPETKGKMKLDRNINPGCQGKYALLLQRKDPIIASVDVLQKEGNVDCFCVRKDAVDFGDTPDTEFFVIRLKDKYASAALQAYADAAVNDDTEWANEIYELARRASLHKNKQQPT